MKIIRQNDLGELNDVIVELPAFRDLKSKESIKNLLDIFTHDVYIDKPAELFDTFNYQLSKKMQSTFFRNYGIDEDYGCNLMGYIKTDLAYSLEKLFQNKGSNNIFKFLAIILESIFPRINFYNIEVHKKEVPNGPNVGTYVYRYKLKPIYIQDESSVLKEPGIDVSKTRKYLMDLKNFEEYTVWPVPTNLVYIQFNVGAELINNLDTFLNGIRSYGATYLSGLYFNYLSSSGVNEKLEASDLELLVSFFQINLLSHFNPEWDLTTPGVNGSSLSTFESGSFDRLEQETDAEYQNRIDSLNEQKCSSMGTMAILLKDYQAANYANRGDMEDLRRRWQFFLRTQETTSVCYNTLEELNQKVKDKYPRLFEDFFKNMEISFPEEKKENDPEIEFHEKESIFTFFIKLYSIFLNGASSSFIQAKTERCFDDYKQPRPVINYTWRDENSNVISTSAEFTYIPIKEGSTALTLTVENIDGFIDSDTTTIISSILGSPSPSVSIDKNKIVNVGTEVQVKAIAETITGEVIEGYEWWLDGKMIKTSVGEIPVFIPTKSKKINIISTVNSIKDYELELKVWDSTGNANYNTIVIRSIKEGAPEELYPQAFAGPNCRGIVNDPLPIVGSGKDIETIKIHNTDWILTYIDVVFGSLFLNNRFVTNYLDPIMDLFQKYFFPVELDYIADLSKREKIKDKWNAIGTESIINTTVTARHTSIQTPIRGLDKAFSFIKIGGKHSYIYKKDFIQIYDLPITRA